MVQSNKSKEFLKIISRDQMLSILEEQRFKIRSAANYDQAINEINKKKFDGFSKSIRDAIMRVSGEKFGEYSAGWDRDNKASTRLLKRKGIREIPLPPKAMAELKERWSVIEPKWIKDAAKLGIDSKAAVRFYRDQLIKIEGVK